MKNTINNRDFDIIMAQDKMLEEMAGSSNPIKDIIHNYLCDNIEADEDLLDGVLKPDRTIDNAVSYLSSKAYDYSSNNGYKGMVMVDHPTGFSWLREYFTMEELPKLNDKPNIQQKLEENKRIREEAKKKEAEARAKKIEEFERNPYYKDYLHHLKGTNESEYQKTIEALIEQEEKAKQKKVKTTNEDNLSLDLFSDM
ncbi:TPA: Cas9 inhibitor AcrIIA9 family protein [Streptococcus agalactiae]|nr:hypothetical protein [Streptococcus agalactiae]HEO4177383.1 hypothetical protein [Streptococcus agalactiae]